MATLKELKTRIGSVSSSEKITGAMKMISSAKVRKSEMELRRLLPFKEQIKTIMGHILRAGVSFTSPLIEEREPVNVAIVIYGSDDGLCGAYNVNIFKYMVSRMAELRKNPSVKHITIFPVGRKVARAAEKLASTSDRLSVENIEGVNSKMEGDMVNDFTLHLQRSFLANEYDLVEVEYMHFYSMGRQRPKSEQLFPVEASALENEISGAQTAQNTDILYIFEPDPNSIFNQVLPMHVLSTMQEVTIENRASEQAARIMAMQAANDNAHKLLENLNLEYNKLRQQSITTELLDILGGQVEK